MQVNLRSCTRLILFPGLGADGRLFDAQRRGLTGVRIETPAWIEPAGDDENVESYSQRIAGTIQPAKHDECLFLGGVSFGALVALEIARHLRGVEAVFMMGGCRDTRAVASFLRFACQLAGWTPLPLFKSVLSVGAVGLVMFESLQGDHLKLYQQMLNDVSPRQARWAAKALLDYRSIGDPPGVRVVLIHGNRDLIIHPKNVDPDYRISGGKHLVSLTCSATVNRILAAEMSRPQTAGEAGLAVAGSVTGTKCSG
jgi:pimeloyl-ACP methyl ester carboxylesterase